MQDLPATNERAPIGRISVLEDTNNDGKMDKKTVFMDGLVLPRALKVLDHGVLIGEPPHLWLARDTNGDLKADSKELVVDTYGQELGNIEAAVVLGVSVEALESLLARGRKRLRELLITQASDLMGDLR